MAQPCDKSLKIAIEAQDFEFDTADNSKAGIVAEITWCGTRILTGVPDDTDPTRAQWNCSKTGQEEWMKNSCPVGLGQEQCDEDFYFKKGELCDTPSV